MKKIILTLFLILTSLAFARWENGEMQDDFGDANGHVYAVTEAIDKKSDFRVLRGESNYWVDLFFDKANLSNLTLGKEGEKLKIRYKIDNSEPGNTYGYVWEEYTALGFPISAEFVEKLKKGKMLKIIVEKSNKDKVLSKYDLNGFTKVIERLN